MMTANGNKNKFLGSQLTVRENDEHDTTRVAYRTSTIVYVPASTARKGYM